MCVHNLEGDCKYLIARQVMSGCLGFVSNWMKLLWALVQITAVKVHFTGGTRKYTILLFGFLLQGSDIKCLESQETHFCLSTLTKKTNPSSISHLLLRYSVAANCATQEKFMRKVNPHQNSGGKEVLSSAKESKIQC